MDRVRRSRTPKRSEHRKRSEQSKERERSTVRERRTRVRSQRQRSPSRIKRSPSSTRSRTPATPRRTKYGPNGTPAGTHATPRLGRPRNSNKVYQENTPRSGFQVVTYQIPVPLGDCSIHLLLDGRNINKVIMIDGGIDSDGVLAKSQIQRALRAVDKEYGVNWQCCAWVVTHWDADHHYGMIEFFNDELHNGPFSHSRRLPYFVKHPLLYCGGQLPKEKRPSAFRKHTPYTDLTKHLINLGFKILTSNIGQGLLGRDLFTGEKVFNPISLKTEKGFLNKTRPRFCVLGADGWGVTSKEKYQIKPDANETSILAMLYWPDTHHCSYFTGGDGNPLVEEESVIPFLEGMPVTVIKLDHHGSSNEFFKQGVGLDLNIVDRMQARKVIVTPGKQYGHPSWDVLLFLYHYFKFRRNCIGDDQDTNYPRVLFGTRTPYWIIKSDVKNMDINISKLENVENVIKAWESHRTMSFSTIDTFIAERNFRESINLEAKEAAKLEKARIEKLAKERNQSYIVCLKAELARKREEKKSLKKNLKSFNENDSDLEEEPDVDDAFDLQETIEEARRDLAFEAQQHWHLLSSQEISLDPDPKQDKYYLLKLTSVNSPSDDGEIKVTDVDGFNVAANKKVVCPGSARSRKSKGKQLARLPFEDTDEKHYRTWAKRQSRPKTRNKPVRVKAEVIRKRGRRQKPLPTVIVKGVAGLNLTNATRKRVGRKTKGKVYKSARR